MNFNIIKNTEYLYIVTSIAVILSLSFITNLIFYKFIKRVYINNCGSLILKFFLEFKNSSYFLLTLIYLIVFTNFLKSNDLNNTIAIIFKAFFFITITWVILNFIDYSCLIIEENYKRKDYLNSLRIITRIKLLKQIVKICMVTLGIALFLLNFDSVKEIGKGILVSATVIGAIFIFAAQKLLGNIISGLQISFTIPISIGDYISIAGESGIVYEINLTYIIIRTWDQRSLIMPASSVLEKPFANWVHPDSKMQGEVTLYVDYNLDIENLRLHLNKLLSANLLWDKIVGTLQVSDVTENNMVLRIVVSAKNVVDLWNLRCYVREALIKYILEKDVNGLPKLSAKIHVKNDISL